jgi:hypothetical protein
VTQRQPAPGRKYTPSPEHVLRLREYNRLKSEAARARKEAASATFSACAVSPAHRSVQAECDPVLRASGGTEDAPRANVMQEARL